MSHEQSAPAFELGKENLSLPIITFEYADGGSKAFSYEHLRNMRYRPDDTLRMRFAAVIVTIRGRNLLPIWRAIRSRRVRLLRAGRAVPKAEQADTEPHIDSISFADRAVTA